MNGISLSQGINEKAAQVDFNDRSRLMPRHIQIKLPSPQVNHNDTKQAKDIVQVKSKITTNNTVSCDYADINAKLSEKSDPPEDKPDRPAIEPTPGELSEDEALRYIIDVIVFRKSIVIMGANSEYMRSYIQQIDTHGVFAGTVPDIKEVDTWCGSISWKHFTDIKDGKIILSGLIDNMQHGNSIPWISNDECICIGCDPTTSWWIGNIPVSQFDEEIMSRLTDMVVTFKVATCCPVDDITHNGDINQVFKLEPVEIDGLPACGATDGHPGNDKMHNIPIALAKADCQKLTLDPNLTHETTEWSNKWLT